MDKHLIENDDFAARPLTPECSSGERGQTIIEATIALASILLTLGAIAISISTSVSNSQFIKQQSQASKYAQEAMEYFRYQRNVNPGIFFAEGDWIGSYCFGSDKTLVSGTCTGVNISNSFKREVRFDLNPSDCGAGTKRSKKVTVIVSWSSGKCNVSNTFCHKSQLESCFTDQTGTSNQL